MSVEEKTARLNLVRYGVFLVVVLALTITPTSLYLAGGGVSVILPTLMATALSAAMAVAVYMGYAKYLGQA